MAKWDGKEAVWVDDHDVAIYITHQANTGANTPPTMLVEVYQDHDHIEMTLTMAECEMLHGLFLAMAARLEET